MLKDDEFGLSVLSIKTHRAAFLREKEKSEKSDGLGTGLRG